VEERENFMRRLKLYSFMLFYHDLNLVDEFLFWKAIKLIENVGLNRMQNRKDKIRRI